MSEPPASAEDLADLFDNAPCGYLSFGPEGCIVRVNATLSNWLGMGGSDLAGKRFQDLLSIPSRIFYETNFAPLLRLQGTVEEMALDLVTAGGEKLPGLINASVRRALDGGVIETRAIILRATARRGYERDLQGREALAVQALADEQAISTLREQFIAILGHDLRNPLASVSSGVRLLQRDPSKEKAERIAVMMHASVLRMSGMIDNVLDFARGRLGGGIGVEPRPADLAAAVLQVIEELRMAHPDRQIDLSCRLPDLIDCDAPRLAQMLSNLVGNACEHGDPATYVRVDAFTSDDTLEISVANGGRPIPDDKLRALFQPFSHEPGSTPRKGLGLGLYIASQIAKSHGGALMVNSSVVETRFIFRMPLTSA